MLVSVQSGRSTASILDAVVAPRYRISRNPVVYLPSYAASASEVVGIPEIGSLLTAVAREGFTVVVPTITGLWGNATCESRINDVLAWARSTWGASNAKAILIGTSMGADAALNYAANNPTLVAAVVGIIPAIDLQAIRVADTGSLRGSIDTAWGVTYPTALPANSNPAVRTAALSAIPQQLWADTTTPDNVSANIATYASAVGADLRATLTAGHTQASIAQVDSSVVVPFVQAHTA